MIRYRMFIPVPNCFSIQDPQVWVKIAPDPGPGSATLVEWIQNNYYWFGFYVMTNVKFLINHPKRIFNIQVLSKYECNKKPPVTCSRKYLQILYRFLCHTGRARRSGLGKWIRNNFSDRIRILPSQKNLDPTGSRSRSTKLVKTVLISALTKRYRSNFFLALVFCTNHDRTVPGWVRDSSTAQIIKVQYDTTVTEDDLPVFPKHMLYLLICCKRGGELR